MARASQLFVTGTMRSGGSLVNNILSLHSQIAVFGERVHYFRFCDGRYDPLTPENVERMLHHQRIRVKHRFNEKFDVEPMLAAILERGISGGVCYDEMMKSLLAKSGKRIWGEQVAFAWRQIPKFLNLFPTGKAIHVYRDLRGVLSSWRRMTFQPDQLYLACIFNWIDSINHLQRYREILPADRYLPIRFEDLHAAPEETVRRICEFVGIPLEDIQLQPDHWPEVFEKQSVEANVSSYTKQKVYGFEPQRSNNWRTGLQEWEIGLAEFLAGDLLQTLGYEPFKDSYPLTGLRDGLSHMRRHPFMLKHLQVFLATGEGMDQMPNDPTDPRNWGAPEDPFKRFTESSTYKSFQDDRDEVEAMLARKFGARTP